MFLRNENINLKSLGFICFFFSFRKLTIFLLRFVFFNIIFFVDFFIIILFCFNYKLSQWILMWKWVSCIFLAEENFIAKIDHSFENRFGLCAMKYWWTCGNFIVEWTLNHLIELLLIWWIIQLFGIVSRIGEILVKQTWLLSCTIVWLTAISLVALFVQWYLCNERKLNSTFASNACP